MNIRNVIPICLITLGIQLFFLCTCTPQTPAMKSMVVNPVAGTSAYTFLSLGDSYTIGERVPEADRWSIQLVSMLRNDKIDVANPDIIARTGWTTAELQEAINASGNQKTYSLVSLMIGVNNQYRGQSQDRYRAEFGELLQTATKFAGGRAARVFVLSIPDWGASPFAAGRDNVKIAREIDQFNAVAKDECQKAGIAFIDITSLSRSAAGDATQFAPDGLHYSGKQMGNWAGEAMPVVKDLLKK